MQVLFAMDPLELAIRVVLLLQRRCRNITRQTNHTASNHLLLWQGALWTHQNGLPFRNNPKQKEPQQGHPFSSHDSFPLKQPEQNEHVAFKQLKVLACIAGLGILT